jgi:hypothetical protein
MERTLVHLYRELLFHERDAALRLSLRDTLRKIRDRGLKEKDDLIIRRRKQCKQIQTKRLKAKLQRQIKAMQQASSSEESDTSSSDTSSNTSENEPKYTVHRIMGFRLKSDNSRQYLVRWKGYDSDNDTWEPVDQLMEDHCGDLIARFHREHMRFI